MKEIEIGAGERITSAVARVVAAAPAFCVFNGVRLEATAGSSEADVWTQWTDAIKRREFAATAPAERARIIAIGRAYVKRKSTTSSFSLAHLTLFLDAIERGEEP